MSDLELRSYDIKAGYVAWCRGEVTKQQAEEAFDWFARALKAEAWDEAVDLARDYSFIGNFDQKDLKRENPYRGN